MLILIWIVASLDSSAITFFAWDWDFDLYFLCLSTMFIIFLVALSFYYCLSGNLESLKYKANAHIGSYFPN
jgi:uncharacterized integral membrane protein